MTLSRLAIAVRPVPVLAAFALFADLFLDWREASVRASGVAVEAGASAWSGWGAVAGVLLIAFVAVELTARRPVASGSLALLASGFTVVEFFTGEAQVEVAGVASVGTGEALWPAWVGLALAAVLGVSAAVRLAAHIHVPRVVGPPTTAKEEEEEEEHL